MSSARGCNALSETFHTVLQMHGLQYCIQHSLMQLSLSVSSHILALFDAGEIKYMSTGSAPISSEVFEFLRICFGATVSEGYGMTETACTISMTRPDDATIGHVGAPVDCAEIKLEDIPDMNYKNTDQPYPRGEVCPCPSHQHTS